MNKTYLLLLLTLSLSTKAQEKIVTPDLSKAIGRTYSSQGKPIPLGGSANTKSVDLNWKPILTKKYVEIEHESPDEEYIDSIKEAKLKLKEEHEQNHPAPEGNQVPEQKNGSITVPFLGRNFAGNQFNGPTPLDNSLAISNGGYIVSAVNATIDYYNISGANLYSNAITSFLPFSVAGVCDPVVVYDPRADRFIFLCVESPLTSNSRIFLSFSKSNSPMDGWWCYQLTGDPTGNGDAFDYPKLGINDSEVFIAGNLYAEPVGSFHQSVIYQMNKLAGYAGETINQAYFAGIGGSPCTLLPVSYGQGDDIATGMYFVSTHPAGGHTIDLYQVTGNWCCGPVLNRWQVATNAYTLAANSHQHGTTAVLNVGDCRVQSGMYLNGIIHFAFNSDAGGGYCGINYNRLTLSTLTNISSMFELTGYDYAYPSIVSFAKKPTCSSVMIGFGRSGNNIYPEMRAVNCNNDMVWSNSILVRPSVTFCERGSGAQRWGDYTGAARNHNSAQPSVWMGGMVADNLHNWNTWIAEIHSYAVSSAPQITNTQSGKIFPNPVTENFTVEFALEENSALDISVVDMEGRVVKELFAGEGKSGDNVFSFNKANLTSGSYFLLVKSDTQIIRNEKIVIVN